MAYIINSNSLTSHHTISDSYNGIFEKSASSDKNKNYFEEIQ